MTLETNGVLPLGQQPEGNLDPMGKLEKAKDKLFKDIDILEKNLKTLNQKNIELENYVKDMENKYGCK
tara:strand:+ start:234 stop:437 length:204 start_codon:yes stop_codon:yes gene_type:complete